MGLKQISRRKKVIGYLCSGFSEVLIAKKLGVSERTVRRDVKSVQVQEYIDELLRRQLKDIEEGDDRKIRLQYRDKLLGRLMPKKVAQTQDGEKTPIILEMWKPEDDEHEKAH